MAAAWAETGDFSEAVTWQKKAIDLLSEDNDRPLSFVDDLNRLRDELPIRRRSITLQCCGTTKRETQI